MKSLKSSLFFLLSIFVFNIQTPVYADTFKTSVVKISEAKTLNDQTIVMLSHDGRVGFVDANNAKDRLLLNELVTGLLDKKLVEVTLDSSHQITAVRVLNEVAPKALSFARNLNLHYEPTVLSSYAEAFDIFNELNPNYSGWSECYNRAHVWAYEEYNSRGLYSQKVFLFFTESYIRDYNYGWWFHVAPVVVVAGEGEYVIDPTFTNSPLGMKDWTDNFIYSQDYCPDVTYYSQYSEHQYEAYCYTIREPMYFWQPLDVEQYEIDKSAKTDFISWEIDAAYSQGF